MMNFGLRCEFTPFLEWPLLVRSGYSFVSLRLETFLKYGGPLEDFRKNLSHEIKPQYFSDYLPVSASTWDQVHQLATADFLREGFITCRKALSEESSAEVVVRDLLSSLPKSVEVAVLVRNREEVNRVRDLNGVFVAIAARDWLGDPLGIDFADRVLELEVETDLIRSDYNAVEKIIGELVLAKASRSCNVTLVLPAVVTEETFKLVDDFALRMKKDHQ